MKRRSIDSATAVAEPLQTKVAQDEFYDGIFARTRLLLTPQDRETIRNASVAIVGLGGIGGISAEMIVRLGVGHIGLADIDVFDPTNLNRQLYSTFKNAFGPNRRHSDKKAHIAEDRMKAINPFCDVQVIANGIDHTNVEEFCKGRDVIIAQPDRESIKVLLHRIAKKYSIPLVTASRVNCNGNRWTLTAKVWDYRADPELRTFEETNHAELLKYSLEELTPALLEEYDNRDKVKVRSKWRDVIQKGDTAKYGLIDADSAWGVVEESPEFFHKCHIVAPIANIAGAMGSIKAIKLIIGAPIKNYAFDFWNGEAVNLE